jgi:hypothetical protein
LTVAKTRQCPVYPIWVSGQEWIDCVPFDMVNYQYIDCRAHEYGAGILRILEILGGTKRSVPIPEGFFGVKLPSNQVVTFQHRTFRDVNEFLTQLYVNYVRWAYEPYTCGVAWVLINSDTKRLAVPWFWLYPQNRYRSLHDIDLNWKTLHLAEYGINPGTRWEITKGSISAAGFALKTISIFNQLNSKQSISEAHRLHNNYLVKSVEAESVDLATFPFSIIIGMSALGFRWAFVEAETKQP